MSIIEKLNKLICTIYEHIDDKSIHYNNNNNNNDVTNVVNEKFPITTLPSTINLGGIIVNDILANKTPVEVLTKMLVVYQYPQFQMFSINQLQTIEVGSLLSGIKIFNWSTINSNNITDNNLKIINVNTNDTLILDLPKNGTQSLNIGTITNTLPITQSWKMEGKNSKNETFISNNYTVNSIYPYFFGKSSIIPVANQALINSGTKVVANSNGDISVNFNANAEYLWFAIPATSSSKTKWFVDALNNASIGSPSDLFGAFTTVSIDSPSNLWNNQNYKIYISNFATTQVSVMQLKNS